MAVSDPETSESSTTGAPARLSRRRRDRAGGGAPSRDPLARALRVRPLRAPQLEVRHRLGVVLAFLALAIVGPLLTDDEPLEFGGPTDAAAVVGVLVRDDVVRSGRVRAVRLRPARGVPRRRVGGGIAWVIGAAVGFTAGYRGGWVDDVLNMLTNVVLVIPTLAILIIVSAYLNVHSYRPRRS